MQADHKSRKKATTFIATPCPFPFFISLHHLLSFQKLVLVNPSKDLSLSIYAVTYIIIPGPIHPLPYHYPTPNYSISFD